MESIENAFKGQTDFGRKVSVTISRNGDLISNMYLKVELPPIQHNPLSLFEMCSLAVTIEELQLLPECIREDCQEIRDENKENQEPMWVKNLGNQLIKEVNFDIGGNNFDYPEWLEPTGDLD